MAKAKGKGKKKQTKLQRGKQKKVAKKKIARKASTKGAGKKKAVAKSKVAPRHKVSGVETSPIVTTTETIVAEEVTLPSPEVTEESASTGFVEPTAISEGESGSTDDDIIMSSGT